MGKGRPFYSRPCQVINSGEAGRDGSPSREADDFGRTAAYIVVFAASGGKTSDDDVRGAAILTAFLGHYVTTQLMPKSVTLLVEVPTWVMEIFKIASDATCTLNEDFLAL
jgi:hypothetical protein